MISKKYTEIIVAKIFEMFPDSETELNYENEFQLLVAIMMSAQTTDKQVNIVNETFFQVLKTPENGKHLGEEGIKSYIKKVNFFNNKSKNIYKTSVILSEKNGEIPKKLEELIKLPGVGIKTAKVFLSIIEKSPYLGVDTHVHRVLNRIGFVNTKNALETDKKVEKIFSDSVKSSLHQSLIFFGRYHCTAKNPKCEKCEIAKFCKYFKNLKTSE